MDKQQEFVLRTVEERDIRFIRLWFTDVLGFLKSFAITPAELEDAFERGREFDGSAIEGYARVQEADMVAKPDPSTFQVLPGKAGGGVARMFCDVLTPDGSVPFDADPRWVLKRNLERAGKLGFTVYVRPELEFYLFDDAEHARPLDRGSYFDQTPLDLGRDFRRVAIEALEGMGIPVMQSHHEIGPSQHEIDLREADALTTADNIMTCRLVVKEAALERQRYATFMPKPIEGLPGSGMDTHLSLFEGERNAFFDPTQEARLSKTARSFIAGLLVHAREYTAVTNQWINSYKRLVPGFDAPTKIAWAQRNRSAMVRVGGWRSERVDVEVRAPDPAANPYLAFAVLLAAGTKGVEEDYQLPPEAGDNLGNMTEAELRAAGIEALPVDLHEALAAMESSELVAEALGEHVFEYFLRNKRSDWQAYQRYVSPFERDRYLALL
ncbi:MAG TPA: glutamine synthetase family protein [Actinomycetes bacterium]|nr:glutamine synthetase family protein [Actinomycetes bacterium]